MRFLVVSLTLALSLTACVKVSPQEPSAGTATLSWEPVKLDTSGRPLKSLAGYKIHYGLSASSMWYTVRLPNPRQTTYVVKDLLPGTWYFATSAYTSDGTESAWSNVASKTVEK